MLNLGKESLYSMQKTHWQWAQMFLTQPGLPGIIDSHGVELVN